MFLAIFQIALENWSRRPRHVFQEVWCFIGFKTIIYVSINININIVVIYRVNDL